MQLLFCSVCACACMHAVLYMCLYSSVHVQCVCMFSVCAVLYMCYTVVCMCSVCACSVCVQYYTCAYTVVCMCSVCACAYTVVCMCMHVQCVCMHVQCMCACNEYYLVTIAEVKISQLHTR